LIADCASIFDAPPREAEPFTRLDPPRTDNAAPRAARFSFPTRLQLNSIASVRGLYRKERTDHGRQPAPVALSVVPKRDNRVRVAENPPSPTGAAKLKFLDRVRWHLRVKRYSIRTEQAYIDWIRRFIVFHNKRHPEAMGEEEIAAFLSHLALDRHVAASRVNAARGSAGKPRS
jgi:Phage integrase, N-terminal SAM-like domain